MESKNLKIKKHLNEWIDVNDKKPKHNEEVIIRSKLHLILGANDKVAIYDSDNETFNFENNKITSNILWKPKNNLKYFWE